MESGIKCNGCDKEFYPGMTNGEPNGLGFQQQNGTIINLCRDCIRSLGEMDDSARKKFLRNLQEKTGR